jgi:hypothetical protein
MFFNSFSENWREINIQIEEDLNNYLKSINYSNEKLTEVLLVLIIRNDDFTVMKGGEGIRKHRGEESYGCSLRVDYNEFKNGNEQTRKLLIYQAWLSIKSRAKGFLRVGIGVILDWFF